MRADYTIVATIAALFGGIVMSLWAIARPFLRRRGRRRTYQKSHAKYPHD